MSVEVVRVEPMDQFKVHILVKAATIPAACGEEAVDAAMAEGEKQLSGRLRYSKVSESFALDLNGATIPPSGIVDAQRQGRVGGYVVVHEAYRA